MMCVWGGGLFVYLFVQIYQLCLIHIKFIKLYLKTLHDKQCLQTDTYLTFYLDFIWTHQLHALLLWDANYEMLTARETEQNAEKQVYFEVLVHVHIHIGKNETVEFQNRFCANALQIEVIRCCFMFLCVLWMEACRILNTP